MVKFYSHPRILFNAALAHLFCVLSFWREPSANTPPGWAERAGNGGRGERVPGGAPGELPAGPQDPSARACALADPAVDACDTILVGMGGGLVGLIPSF